MSCTFKSGCSGVLVVNILRVEMSNVAIVHFAIAKENI